MEGTRDDVAIFAQQVITGKAILVSDGSYKLGRSSAAFTTVPEKKITGSLTIPGKTTEQSSYRAELGGILAAVVFANNATRTHQIEDGTCTMICDNKGALASAFGYRHINPRWKCYDLLCMIRFHIANSPIKWKHRHVKGHQDDSVPYDELDVISQANVDVDNLAKIELRRDRQVREESVLLGQCWRLKIKCKDEHIQGNIEQELRSVIYEERMKKLWAKKFDMNRNITNEEWTLLNKVNSTHSDWEHLFMVKYSMGLLPTKLNMVRRKHDDDEKCPCCENIEDTDHILKCQSKPIDEVFSTEVEILKQYLQNITSWEMKGAVIELINSFREGRAPAIHHNWNSTVADLVQEQYELGQRAFLSGLWIMRWTKEQTNFQKTQKSRKHGITIITSIIKKVQKLIREMWYGRNEELHNNEQSRANKSKSNEYDSMIVDIMRRKRSIPSSLLAPGDRHYFRRKLNIIQKMRNTRKERWIRDAELILNKYDNENESEQVRRFREYFMHRDDG